MKECAKLHTKGFLEGADYYHYQCQLMCLVSDHINIHNINEGKNCPGKAGTPSADDVCRAGECVKRTSTDATTSTPQPTKA
jgi:hypothetical protein